jgi:hypothetical protein
MGDWNGYCELVAPLIFVCNLLHRSQSLNALCITVLEFANENGSALLVAMLVDR